MLTDKKIGIIGAGNMGSALASGLIQHCGVPKDHVCCTDASDSQLDQIREKLGIFTTPDNTLAIQKSDIIIYAVKPQILSAVLRETADALTLDKLVISIAAGIPISLIETVLQKKMRVIRVMPNVAAAIREGAAAVAAGTYATETDVKLAMAIFDGVGRSVEVKETLMDAVTGLSGSGPAYVFVMAEALADAGVNMGLTRADARLLTAQTLLGAARMLLEDGAHPGVLKDMVTSPGGTTIAGLFALEQGGFRAALMRAVEAATCRSAELGQQVMGQFAETDTP
ncbi:pyrroline-5-carboxylate reductase [Desulfosarcina sp. OttesenSCG-928-G10]|nr:pyrroline-5-carboxylate reductase [Desulfosarcina sp. OttesenSCG-928-G10]MDL2321299.1 pyrroline-5-carboxylate reductase [Desulfosarcina sp. OttesenSCG-928-B08]